MGRATLVILSVALLTWVVCFWQGEQLLGWYPIPVRGTAGRVVIASMFGILAVVLGLVANSLYGRMLVNRPASATQIYRWVGGGMAGALSVAGFVVPTALWRQGPVAAWTVLNGLWRIGYGWVLPALLR